MREIPYEKSLEYCNPILAKEWHPTKNGKLKPSEITVNSNKKVWWYLPYDDPKSGKHFDFEWEATVSNRNIHNCPFLSGQAVWKGYNDLQTLYPLIAKEWHPTKNGMMSPKEVSYGSKKIVWWELVYYDDNLKKEFTFEWKASVKSRTIGKTGCPYISGKAIWKGYNDLQTVAPKLAIEWDEEKNAGIKSDSVASKSNIKRWWKCEKGHSWEASPSARYKSGKIRDCPFCSGARIIKGENDLFSINPELKEEWDFDKNTISPYEISPHSNRDAYWKCINGHSWKVIISARSYGNGCPYCSHKIIEYGVNDISVEHKDIYKEWNEEKNGIYASTKINLTSKYWWRCAEGHEWETTIISRIKRKSNCPYCSGRKAIYGKNDIVTHLPSLIKGWDFEKNEGINPKEISAGSEKKVWWKCNEGHHYKRSVANEVKSKGCPYCIGVKVIKNVNSINITHPYILEEWDYKKNILITPDSVSAGSEKKVWWRCKEGHSYQARINTHTKRLYGCPYCSGRLAISGKTDLLTCYPEIAEMWDYGKNRISPSNITAKSEKKVWWKCIRGHSWRRSVAVMRMSSGCPYCYRDK